LSTVGDVLGEVERREPQDAKGLLAPLRRSVLASKEAVSPAVGLEATLHPYVAFGIMPLFAVSNAGVTLGAAPLGTNGLGVILGVAFGLVVGKPVGIVLASLAARKIGLATLPRGVDTKSLLVMGCVAGIGFTMAIFIAQLAFGDERLLGLAKIAVLGGSTAAGALGALVGVLLLPKRGQPDDVTVDQAERSTSL
jgi:NhaA family Na+:H+ antiporter